MKILVTGSEGTLGTSLVRELRKRGHEVWGVDLQHQPHEQYVRADISSFRQLERVFTEIEPDCVYHLAAEFGRINGEEYYDTLWRTNVVGTRNILEWQRRLRFKLIFASSSEIYGETPLGFLTEDVPNRVPIVQMNDYAMTKWVNEMQCMNYEKRYGNEIVRMRLFNAYGPGEYYHRYRSVVCLFCYRALHKLPYTVFKDYHRVFMYIDDCIYTMANIVENFRSGEVYNIGGTEYESVEYLSDLVMEATDGDKSLVNYLPKDEHNVVNKRPEIAKARKDLKHKPLILLPTGIRQTVEWMREVYQGKRREE